MHLIIPTSRRWAFPFHLIVTLQNVQFFYFFYSKKKKKQIIVFGLVVRSCLLAIRTFSNLSARLSLSLDSSPSHFFSDDHRTTSPEPRLISSIAFSPQVYLLILISLFLCRNLSPNKQKTISRFRCCCCCCCWKVLQLQSNCALSSADRFRITVHFFMFV